MRTVRISWKKVVPLGLLVFLVIYFVGPSFLPTKNTLAYELKQSKLVQREKPTFNEDGSLGNFEKQDAPRSGPGEMGKPHSLKPEQKAEEDRLKGWRSRFFLFLLTTAIKFL